MDVYTHLHWSKRHQHRKAAEMGTFTHRVCDVRGLLAATVGGPGAIRAPVSTSKCRPRLIDVLSKINTFIIVLLLLDRFPFCNQQ